ncbi:MAG: hypothetical protein IT479_06535 [Xanthomonadales bacterium]|nr:hypothetical protein [Xanthomonadales bacterium]
MTVAGIRVPVRRHDCVPAPQELRSTRVEILETELDMGFREHGADCWLDLGEFGCYRLDDAGIGIAREAVSEAYATEALMGPVLLHALARHGVYVLHASASTSPQGRLYAFIATSGVGKSTIARHSEAHGWSRVADDLLPVRLAAGAIEARPHLPQPKLDAACQYPPGASVSPELAGIVQLSRGPALSLRKLDAGELMRLVIESTVASRTFTSAMLARHLAFARGVAECLSSGRLRGFALQLADRPGDVDAAVFEALRQLEAQS